MNYPLYLMLGLLILGLIMIYLHFKQGALVSLALSAIVGTYCLIHHPDFERQGTVYCNQQEYQVCGAKYYPKYMLAYTKSSHQPIVFCGNFLEIEDGFLPAKGPLYKIHTPAHKEEFELTKPNFRDYLEGISPDGSKYVLYGDYVATQVKP